MSLSMSPLGIAYCWVLLLVLQLHQESSEAQDANKYELDTARKFARHFFGPNPREAAQRHRKRQVGGRPYTYNVVYILDSSTSVKNVDLKKGIHAMRLLTDKARNDTRFAMILYSKTPRIISNFTSKRRMLEKLPAVERLYGPTNTYAALELCRRTLIGSRRTLNRVLLITDGLSNINKDRMFYEAFQLKMSNVEIFVVAVGRYQYGADEIAALSSIPSTHVYRVANMRGLVRIVMWTPTGYGYWSHNNQN